LAWSRKKTGGFRLIAHLSHPSFKSVYSYIDSEFSLVKYSTFDHAISLIQRLGKGALIGKKDLKSAFRLLPVYRVHILKDFQPLLNGLSEMKLIHIISSITLMIFCLRGREIRMYVTA
jgi:hypothetical protein